MTNKITWMVLDTKQFNIYDTYNAGVIAPAERTVIPVRLWNNYMGIERQPDLTKFGVNFYFVDLEDSSLLSYIKILNAEGLELPAITSIDTITVNLTNEVVISGEPNQGDSEKNYYDFNIVIELPKDVKYKINDIKELVCEVFNYE